MRREVLSLVALLGISACGSPAAQKAKDPKAPALEPAVVNVPLNVPTPVLDTAPRAPNIIPEDQAARSNAVLQGYSLATATMVNQDARMLSQLYAPDAVLHVPDSTVTGMPAVVRSWLGFAHNRSLADFQRITHGQRIIDDSTLADSGVYQMIFKRTAKDSVIEQGEYKTKWRARKDIANWIILSDSISRGRPPKKKGVR